MVRTAYTGPSAGTSATPPASDPPCPLGRARSLRSLVGGGSAPRASGSVGALYYPPGIPTLYTLPGTHLGPPDHAHVRVSAHHAGAGDHWDMHIWLF